MKDTSFDFFTIFQLIHLVFIKFLSFIISHTISLISCNFMNSKRSLCANIKPHSKKDSIFLISGNETWFKWCASLLVYSDFSEQIKIPKWVNESLGKNLALLIIGWSKYHSLQNGEFIRLRFIWFLIMKSDSPRLKRYIS